MARLARIAFLATLLAAVALAACGDDNTEENRYVRELTNAQLRFKADDARLGADATATRTPREGRRTLVRYAAAIADAIVELRRIDVPPAVLGEHRRFVGVFVDWHDDIERFVAAIRNATPRSFERARRAIAAATVTFNESSRRAGTAIDAKLAA